MPSTRHARVRSTALAVGLAATLGVLAGCAPFGNDQPRQVAAADRSGRLLTAVETKTALPSVAALPRGWAPTKNLLRPKFAKDTLSPARCKAFDHGFDDGYLKAATKSYRTYVNPNHAIMGIGIGSHRDAAPSLASLRSTMDHCASFRISKGRQILQMKVQQLRLPHLADDVVTSRFLMNDGQSTVTYDVVRIRVGHNIVLGDLITPKPARPNTKPLVTAARNALLNLS
jgi:hypothetical protein